MSETVLRGWQPMNTAPTNGKNVLLAVQRGPCVYVVQGAFMNRKWMNVADIDAEPLCWMPKVMVPSIFCPWTDEFKEAALSKATA